MRDPQTLREVRQILARLSDLAPGHTVEVRIPPYAAIQCVEGAKHTRGTPPNVVEMNHETLIALLTNELDWSSAMSTGAIHASGDKSDLSVLFAELSRAIKIAP